MFLAQNVREYFLLVLVLRVGQGFLLLHLHNTRAMLEHGHEICAFTLTIVTEHLLIDRIPQLTAGVTRRTNLLIGTIGFVLRCFQLLIVSVKDY